MFKKFLSSCGAKATAFCILSFLGGGINGFLGTGGGIVFIYMLSLLTKNNKKDNFASSLSATVPLSAIGLGNYLMNGYVDFSYVKSAWLPCLLGGILGAYLLDRLRLTWLKAIFSVLLIYSGTCMILR